MQWQQLVDQSIRRRLYRTAYRVLGDSGEAEDTLQEVLLEAFHKSDETEFSPDVPLLRRMTLLRAIDRLRRRKLIETLRATDEAIVDHAPSQSRESTQYGVYESGCS
ncbi:MAG: sigma-70 family RNA polymerase sigma factor [Planctomycetaceae bacterium]|nr:sigma-70 family RNA polymerase sigma factor [Planctomycetaceae bacterium]